MDSLQFGVGYGFIVTASNDGSIPLNSKALAKIEDGGEEAIVEMQRRANAYPALESRVGELLQICARAEEDVRRLVEDRRKLVEALKSGIASLEQFVKIDRIPANNQGLRDMRVALSELGEDFS